MSRAARREAFIHLRGDDNERSVCGEEERAGREEVVSVAPVSVAPDAWGKLPAIQCCPRCDHIEKVRVLTGRAPTGAPR